MPASYPSAIKIFSTKASGDVVRATHVGDLEAEVSAIETALRTGFNHDLLFTDATYDIGKSGATRPRDLFASRNCEIGGTLGVTGVTTVAALLDLSGASAGQVKFPSTQNASTNGRTLDDYDEDGTAFTPALKFGGASVGMTTSEASGSYVKVGQMIYFTLRITLTAKGSSTGAATITGLPKTSGAKFGVIGSIYFFNLATAIASMSGYMGGASTTIQLVAVAAAGAVSMVNMTDAHFANNSDIIISGSYRTNA